MMLSIAEMVVLVVTVLIAGAGSAILLYFMQKRSRSKTTMPLWKFTENTTYGKMCNSDVSVDEIIVDFKLID